MTFSLYCLVKNKSYHPNVLNFEMELFNFFKNKIGFSYKVEYEKHPFVQSIKILKINWDGWWIRVFFEQGPSVQEESAYISKFATPEISQLISSIDQRIRITFASDPDLMHTNHIIFFSEFIEGNSNLTIFDPQRKVFVS